MQVGKFISSFTFLLGFVLLCVGVKLYATHNECCEVDDEPELREYISKDMINFSKKSEWEGVWGELNQCNPLRGVCYAENALSIYDCDSSQGTCILNHITTKKTNPAYAKSESINCEEVSFEGIEILVSAHQAKPNESYFERMCAEFQGKDKESCRQKADFSLIKNEKGITFTSSALLDSKVCYLKSQNQYIPQEALSQIGYMLQGTLSGFYPPLNASFNCAKSGLSKIEKGICNSFATIKSDYILNQMYNYIYDFAWSESDKQKLKKEQLEWIKERNLTCNQREEPNLLAYCLLIRNNERIRNLEAIIKDEDDSIIIKTPQRVHMEFVSSAGAVKIYEKPSLNSNVLHTAILNDKATIVLMAKNSRNGFTKIWFLEHYKEDGSMRRFVGYVQNANIKRDKEQPATL